MCFSYILVNGYYEFFNCSQFDDKLDAQLVSHSAVRVLWDFSGGPMVRL